MSEPINLDENGFKELVIGSKQPVLVDFWATWCAPCRAIAPIIEELAEEYGDKIVFTKLNVDESPSIPSMYGISSIPTILIFKDGKPLQQVIGLRTKKELKEVLDSV